MSKFIFIDGEGITVENNEHLYTVLQASNGSKIERSTGLKTSECFTWLLNLQADNPHSILVGFFLTYDFNMMLKGFTDRSLKVLSRNNKVKIKLAGSNAYYKVEFLPKKFFILTYKIGHIKKRVKIYDIASFFQCSFIKALQQWDIGTPEQLDFISKMKDNRSNFNSVDDTLIDQYNRLECLLGESLITKLDRTFNDLDIKLSSFHGPGAIANTLLKKYGVLDHLCKDADIPIMSAYFGGRINCRKLGSWQTVHCYDIASAYPYSATQLPSFKDCTIVEDNIFDPDLLTGVYKIEFSTPDDKIPAFPVRAKDSSIGYPFNGIGYYWQPEILEAIKNGITVKILEGRKYYPTTDYKPFEFLKELYTERRKLKAIGDNRNIALKLALNSVYGKLCQSIGYGGRPPKFQSYAMAGLITSITRARVYSLMSKNPGSVIGCATDGIFLTKSLDGIDVNTGILGSLDYDVKHNFFIIKPGFYTSDSGNRVRGFRPSNIKWDNIKRVWDADGVSGSLDVPNTQFITMGIASQNLPYATWINTSRQLTFKPSNVICIPSDTLGNFDCIEPYSMPESVPYVKKVAETLDQDFDTLYDEI